ncbi:MAG: polymer-forming cytoskeletal protein [Paludibacteraceae bacterium]|nr:polymer-forming cytoskeletal protein [Paludibacteraceae bacterium]
MAKDIQNNMSGARYNAITTGSKVIGTIQADDDIRIDGCLEGDLLCKGKLIVGQQGLIKGNAKCVNVEIFGTVDGDFTVSEGIMLHSTARFNGNLNTKVLTIEPNAVFNGTCVMDDVLPAQNIAE